MSLPIKNARHAATGIDPYASWLIRHKINRLVATGSITRTDGEDFAQDLSMHVHVAMPKYDPRRGARSTFFKTVLSRRLSSMLAAHYAQKRDQRRQRPLCDGRPCEDALVCDPWAQVEVVLDVKHVLESTPCELRPLAGILAEMTEAEVIRVSGLSRQKVRSRRERIARHFRRRLAS